MEKKLSRRNFIHYLSAAGVSFAGMPSLLMAQKQTNAKPAILGGPKAFTRTFSSWPLIDTNDEKAILHVLHTKKWNRWKEMASFEKEYAKLLRVSYSLGVSSGTSALSTILGVQEIGPGDEVIIPVYTFVATYNVVVLNYALPIFVDTDIDSFQIDANKIEQAITPQTKMIMPVHIGGSPANLDQILPIGKKTGIPIIEDACQAHLAEWKGQKAGTWGLAGAFSFQASKNLNCGEGGAVVSNDEEFIKACTIFQNQGRTSERREPGKGARSSNLRLTEFQGALLLSQMGRLEAQTVQRNKNASYLTSLLNEIPGISPAKLYEGTTQSAYHLYMFRYDKKYFSGLSREQFVEALKAEGIPCSSGYGKMNKDSYVTNLARNRHYLSVYGEKRMNEWLESSQCPQNDKLTDQAVWFTQEMLLGDDRRNMDQIADAIRKIRQYAQLIVIK